MPCGSIEEINDVTTLSIELQSSRLVLKVLNYGSGGGRNKAMGHGSFRGRGRGRQSRNQIECYKFHKLGQY